MRAFLRLLSDTLHAVYHYFPAFVKRFMPVPIKLQKLRQMLQKLCLCYATHARKPAWMLHSYMLCFFGKLYATLGNCGTDGSQQVYFVIQFAFHTYSFKTITI